MKGHTLRAAIALSAAVLVPWLIDYYWAIALPITLLLALVYIRLDRKASETRERRATGRCVECGYDLTGNVSGVCPECGTRRRRDRVHE